jgi:hypothetical protein
MIDLIDVRVEERGRKMLFDRRFLPIRLSLRVSYSLGRRGLSD